MQKILGYMRKAINNYSMISDGDKIGVGISGGKDSLILLLGLIRLKKFININFEIVGLTADLMFDNKPTDFIEIKKICDENNIKYVIEKTNIGPIIFDIRQEKNPCSLCSRMRRGVLHDLAKREGCNKIALGHNSDDWLETFLMNLFNEGRIGTFLPVTYLSIKDIYMIRPLILTPENIIKNTANKLNIPIVKSRCPADGHSKREWTKNYLLKLEKDIPDFKKKLMSAVVNFYKSKK
ncbi:MAG: tRNA 2-thiocytidine biosynthesis protein TtcA [Oscillospiraceae bacterium]|nr:tRNA 2-thiocytidine biosynthesis protein TtcA [Oscillospiraceae bacterium]